MTPSTSAFDRLAACFAIRSNTGRYGTADNSHVLLARTLAMVFRPRDLASAQCFVAPGPGPTAEIEYSPTAPFTPPRSSGSDHSLTDCNQTDGGRPSITSGA